VQHHQPTTVAILGADTLLANALAALFLEGGAMARVLGPAEGEG
jgi:hypothetical protein